MTIFGLLLLGSMGGIIYYLIQTGFYPEILHFVRDPDPYTPGKWEHTGLHNFSFLVLAGVIMFSVFLAPIILRPIDFIANMKNYILGLISYLFMMPTFINIMQIYSMSNLHDISWGNRPATQGVEAITANKSS
jgi:hypothetical protein